MGTRASGKMWSFCRPFTAPDNFLVNAEVGVETPLTKYFSLQTYVQDNYANDPAPGLAWNNDVKLVSALAVKVLRAAIRSSFQELSGCRV